MPRDAGVGGRPEQHVAKHALSRILGRGCGNMVGPMQLSLPHCRHELVGCDAFVSGCCIGTVLLIAPMVTISRGSIGRSILPSFQAPVLRCRLNDEGCFFLIGAGGRSSWWGPRRACRFCQQPRFVGLSIVGVCRCPELRGPGRKSVWRRGNQRQRLGYDACAVGYREVHTFRNFVLAPCVIPIPSKSASVSLIKSFQW